MELSTPRLHLRELELADAERAQRYEADPASMRYTPHAPRTLEESRAYIVGSLASAAERPRCVFDFAIVYEGSYVGRVGFRHTPEEPEGTVMLWYMVDPAVRGRGIAGEASAAVLDFAFDELHAHRAYADIDPRNEASKRVVERLGFRLEAHLVENVYAKGEWCDTLLYGCLRREWIALRADKSIADTSNATNVTNA